MKKVSTKWPKIITSVSAIGIAMYVVTSLQHDVFNWDTFLIKLVTYGFWPIVFWGIWALVCLTSGSKRQVVSQTKTAKGQAKRLHTRLSQSGEGLPQDSNDSESNVEQNNTVKDTPNQEATCETMTDCQTTGMSSKARNNLKRGLKRVTLVLSIIAALSGAIIGGSSPFLDDWVMAGLSGALIGFSLTWLVVWCGGSVIHKLIKWLVLGFFDDVNNKREAAIKQILCDIFTLATIIIITVTVFVVAYKIAVSSEGPKMYGGGL